MRISCAAFWKGTAAGALLLSPVGAAAQSDNAIDQKAMIATICQGQIPLDAKGCGCFAEHALTELDEPQRTYLILTVIQPPAAERHAIARSQPDLQAIAQFIDRNLKACATNGAASPTPPQQGEPDAAE